MPRKFLLIAVVLAVGSLAAWASTQAVVNGGFESGSLTPWTTDSCGTNCNTWSVESTNVHGGGFAAQTIGSHEIMEVLPQYDGVHQGIFTGLITDASLWFKTSASLFAVELFYYTPPGVTPTPPDGICGDTGVLCFDVNSSQQNQWIDYGPQLLNELQSQSGSGKFLSEILIGSGGSNTDVSYLDDVSITAKTSFNPPAMPEPSSLALIGSGLLALAGRRAAIWKRR